MKKVAIYIETEKGKIKSGSFGMITSIRNSSVELYAIIINDYSEKYREELQLYGVQKVLFVTTNNGSANYHPELWSRAAISSLKYLEIDTLIALTSTKAKTVLAMIAAKLDAPLVLNCLRVDLIKNKAEKILYSGKTNGTILLKGKHYIYGMRKGNIDPEQNPCQSESLFFETSETLNKNYHYLGEKSEATDTVDLSEAEVIISGGRGMENQQNFDILKACAKKMNASVGASRVAVDSGWVPYAMQVGQTGVKVNPKVYIACGLSGSVQHYAGMKTSNIIIAINQDPNAAIISNCDYYIVENLFDVVPLLTKKLESKI
ncbi:MAG: electron transfer flavoprotein subunit alpha/FixB family protein [Deltaproteobacteria bacterium]|jgi:electron transfer flavoprotein alpha subunit|nr:electron transfer flavoprotein subunit alpha/FixB family protein [Deltaproteobacteria bacterium]